MNAVYVSDEDVIEEEVEEEDEEPQDDWYDSDGDDEIEGTEDTVSFAPSPLQEAIARHSKVYVG